MGRFIFIIFLLAVTTSEAKNLVNFRAKVLDSLDYKPMVSANIRLSGIIDTSLVYGAVTNNNGIFKIDGIKIGKYNLKITYIGYKTYNHDIEVKDTVLKSVFMARDYFTTAEVQVNAPALMMTRRGDTLSFSGKYFFTRNDDYSDDIIKKIPGIRIRKNGRIFYNNHIISEILVNGKIYPVENLSDIYKILPATQVKKIEFYYKNIEDTFIKQRQMDINTLDIITYDPNVAFGNAKAAYTDDNKYILNTVMNKAVGNYTFSGNATLASIVDQSGGSSADEDFNYDNVNYVHDHKEYNRKIYLAIKSPEDQKNRFGLSYSLENTGSEASCTNNRNYYSLDTLKFYRNHEINNQDKLAHEIKASARLIPWENGTLNVIEQICINNNNANQSSICSMMNADSMLMRNNNLSGKSDNTSYIINSNISFNQRIKEESSFGINFSCFAMNMNSDNRHLNNTASIFDDFLRDSSDKKDRAKNKSLDVDIDANYDYTVSSALTASISAGSAINACTNDDKNYNIFDDNSLTLDTLSSENYISTTLLQKLKTAMIYNFGIASSITLDLSYNYQSDKNAVKLPDIYTGSFYYNYFLYSIAGNISLSEKFMCNINYRSEVHTPECSQRNQRFDVSDPLAIRSGNPNLKMSTKHLFDLNINSDKTSISGSFAYEHNPIIQAKYLSGHDTLINGQYKLVAGSQYSLPVNAGNSKSIGCSFMQTIYPDDFFSKNHQNITCELKSEYYDCPELYNNIKFTDKNFSLQASLNLFGSFMEPLGYELHTDLKYTRSQNMTFTANSLQMNIDSKFNYTLGGFKVNINYVAGLYLKQEQVTNKNSNILNLSLAYKFLNNNFEVRFTAYDILQQYVLTSNTMCGFYNSSITENKSIQRFELSLKYKICDANQQYGSNTSGVIEMN